MTSGQIFLTLIISLIIVQTIMVFARKQFTLLFKLFWLGIWGGALVVVLWPGLMVGIAEALGIGRGADVVIYLSLMFTFFIMFRFYIKVKDLENRLTKLARKISLSEKPEK